MAAFRTPVCVGAAMARDENDRMVGYRAYTVPRKQASRGMSVGFAWAGPVRATYMEAAQDARAAREGA